MVVAEFEEVAGDGPCSGDFRYVFDEGDVCSREELYVLEYPRSGGVRLDRYFVDRIEEY